MPVPYIFEPGTVASSSEVNSNFAHVMTIVGSDSTETIMKPTGDIILGPRDSIQMTAKGDTGANAERGYLQIGWNTDLYSDGGFYRQRRVFPDESSMAMRLGNNGWSVVGTARTDGTLDERFSTAIKITPHQRDPWIYINPNWRIQVIDEAANPSSHSAYRNTLVYFDPAQSVLGNNLGPNSDGTYNGFAIVDGQTFIDARTVLPNLPDRATALLLSVQMWVSEGSGKASSNSVLKLYADDTNDAYTHMSGFTVSFTTSNTKRLNGVDVKSYFADTQGIVRLGSYQNKPGRFVVDPWASFVNPGEKVKLNVAVTCQGYFI